MPPDTYVGHGNAFTGVLASPMCSGVAEVGNNIVNDDMNKLPPGAGWHRYNRATDGIGCTYATWVKGRTAIDWGFGTFYPGITPSKQGSIHQWYITICSRLQ